MLKKRLSICVVGFLFGVWVPLSHAAYIQAYGSVDLDGDFTADSSREDGEPLIPDAEFTRSRVSISDLGLNYTYISSADIGSGELSAYGMLDNSDGSIGSNFETGVLSVAARMYDVISLESTLSGDYDVTFELNISGMLDMDGGSGAANASLFFGPNPGLDSYDSRRWTTSGSINDTLSITRTFNGNADADIGANLFFSIYSIDPGAIMIGDLSHTAVLTMILPDGVSVAGSESGTFLESINVTPVPVPAALPLFAVGLGGLGVCTRRRTASV